MPFCQGNTKLKPGPRKNDPMITKVAQNIRNTVMRGLRVVAHGRTLEMPWPEHPRHPSFGYVIRRAEVDTFVAEHAVHHGAILRQHTEAIGPILRNGMISYGPGASATPRRNSSWKATA